MATAALTSDFLKSKQHTRDLLPSQKTSFQVVIAAWFGVSPLHYVYNLLLIQSNYF